MSLSNKILLVSHDIGGAQLLSSYIFKQGILKPAILSVGPSRSAYENFYQKELFLDQATARLKLKAGEFDLVMTSTSWESSIEIEFINLAKSLGIRTISYIDHWVNYRERFHYPEEGWGHNLPDEIWGHDAHSTKMLKDFFPQLKISNAGNSFLDHQIEISQTDKISEQKNSFLFLTEPISHHLGNKLGYDEFDSLDLFFSKICFLSGEEPFTVTLRAHPSEKMVYQEKYKRYLSASCKYSDTLNVFQDIKKHEFIIGCDTIALYYARFLGKKIFSAIPNQDKCSVPMNEIIYLRDLNG